MPLRHLVIVASLLLAACGSGGDGPSTGDGGGAPGPGGCEAGTVAVKGDCIAPGIPAEACAEGFEHDGVDLCEPILPAMPCPSGLMAVPGDEACREVAGCGDGRWGDIPRDGSTQHVDAGYAGGASDGSEQAPWPTIQEAVDAAAPRAVVAVAAGSYAEQVIVTKPVAIHGTCPAEVIVESPPGGLGIAVGPGGDGTLVRGLSVTGPGFGVGGTGAREVRLEQLRLFDLGRGAVYLNDQIGSPSFTISDSLVERTAGAGLTAIGSELTVERCAVRDASTVPGVSDGALVVAFDPKDGGDPSVVVVEGSLLERGLQGLFAAGAGPITLRGSVIRDLQPNDDGLFGEGIRIEDLGTGAPQATVEGSLIEGAHRAGLVGLGAALTLDASVVRAVAAPVALEEGNPIQNLIGVAVFAQDAMDTGVPTSLVADRSVVTDSADVGFMVQGAAAEIRRVAVRRLSDSGMGLARAIHVQRNNFSNMPASATLDEVVVDGGAYGVVTAHAQLTMTRSAVRGAQSSGEGLGGDGIAVVFPESAANLSDSVVENNARVGVATFGATTELSGMVLRCQPIHLNAETYGGSPPDVTNIGDNECRCGNDTELCKILSTGVSPPSLIE